MAGAVDCDKKRLRDSPAEELTVAVPYSEAGSLCFSLLRRIPLCRIQVTRQLKHPGKIE